MKVILLQDVAKIGRRFEIVDVPHGYALNMLIPKGLAEAATPENVKKVSARKNKMQASETETAEHFDEVVASLAGKSVAVSAELNEQGHMFEALKPAAIVEALSAEGVTVDESMVQIKDPIKEQGAHTVLLVSGDKESPLTIDVVAK